MNAGKYVKNQLSYIEKIKDILIEEKNDIQNNDREDVIVNKLKNIYNTYDFSREELNTHLLLLENKKLTVKFISYSGLIVSTMAIMISLISIVLTLYNSVSELDKFVSQLTESMDKVKEIVKQDIQIYTSLNDYIYWILAIFGAIIIGMMVCDGLNSIIEKRKFVAINIHKSVIEKKIDKIKNEEHQKLRSQEKEQFFNQLEKVLIESKNDSEIVLKACNKIINNIF